jgi:hypothetical protein
MEPVFCALRYKEKGPKTPFVDRIKVTRCVCEKITQKKAQLILLSRLIRNLCFGKKKFLAYFLNFSNTAQSEQSPNFRPIWSPWTE